MATTMDRIGISKWSREELEDKYLRQGEENLLLKKHARKQEEKIKKMATKLLRLVNDKKKEAGRSGNIDAQVKLDDLESRIMELEKQNEMLKEKNKLLKEQLATAPRTHLIKVQSRPGTATQGRTSTSDPRITKNLRYTGPVPGMHGRRTGMHTTQHPSGLKDELNRMENIVGELNERIVMYDQENHQLQEELRAKDLEHQEDMLKLKQQLNQGQRSNIQENIDIIRLQRDVKDKSSRLSQLQGQYEQLEMKLRTLRQTHDQVLVEMEHQNEQLKLEQKRTLSLQQEVKTTSSADRMVKELQERVLDLERECEIVKEANEKLVSSAFDLEREREWKQKEQALKVQIAQLEATLRADVGEKGSILDRLNAEREDYEKMEKENKDVRVKYYQLKQEHDELKDKMGFFTKDSHIDFQELEEALLIVKQKKESNNKDLEFLHKVEEEKRKDTSKAFKELQAEFAETINELEKTRNMLIVQYKINKDYQQEVEAVTGRMEEMRKEYDTKLDEYAVLLDLRANRIKKLEHQMRDVAYGTRHYKITHEVDEGSDVEEMEQSVELANGENLFEIHIKNIVLSPEALREMNDDEPSVFATWGFYEHELQATPILRGPRADFAFTSQYIVKVDDFFLHYLQKDSCTVEMHHCLGTEDYRTIAACQLKLRDLLDRPEGRLHGTAQLTGVSGEQTGLRFGVLEYWVRLKVPMTQALRLYKERVKALGYIESNVKVTEEAIRALDTEAEQRPPGNVNELTLKLYRCHNVASRNKDVQPSPYCVYQFFDYPDHVTTTVTNSNNPQFNDYKTFNVPVTIELDKYLKTAVLDIYVFDDMDPEQNMYLGKASVPLISLAHNKPFRGNVQLVKADGQTNGTVELSLKWHYSYIPPKAGTTHKKLTDEGGPDLAVFYLPGEEEEIRDSTKTKRPASSKKKSHEKSAVPSKKRRSPVEADPGAGGDVVISASSTAHQYAAPPGRDEESVSGTAPFTSSVAIPGSRLTTDVSPVRSRGASHSSGITEGSPVSGEDDIVTEDEISEASDMSGQQVQAAGRHHLSAESAKSEASVASASSSTGQRASDATEDRHVGSRNSEHLSDTQFEEQRDSSEMVTPRSETESETDTDVVMPSPGSKLGSTLANMPASDMVKVGINHLTLEENTRISDSPEIRQLFVEYRFLGIPSEETECPYALPKPAPGQQINFNFLKVFHVDFENNYERRQYLASMLMPDDPEEGRIRFTIVSEPEDDEGECEDVGYALVDIKDILKANKDLEEIDVDIVDVDNDETVIGALNVTVVCKEALKAVKEEMPA